MLSSVTGALTDAYFVGNNLKMIQDVSFEILSKCPFNCLHCSSCSSMECQEEFSYEKILDIVEQLAKLPVKRICLSGGEPFLRQDLPDIVEVIAKNGIICDIYSSGVIKDGSEVSAISKDTLIKLKEKGLNRIMFNMQAFDEAKYDFITGTKGQQPCLFASIKNAVECDVDTEIHFVPMRRNVDQIDKILAFADEQNVKQVSFLKLMNHGRACDYALELGRYSEKKVRTKLMKLAKSNPKIRIGIPLTYGNSSCGCHAITEKIYIKYDGSVYGCEAFKYIEFDGIKVPNVHEKDIQSIIYDSEYFKKSRELLFKYKKNDNKCPVQNFIKEKRKEKEMSNLNDKDLLNDVIDAVDFHDKLKEELLEYIGKEYLPDNLSYPLDDLTIDDLIAIKKTIPDGGSDLPYSKVEILNVFWKNIIIKSIQCLRLFDVREPFYENPEKTIIAYGIDNLDIYYKSYTKFESLLYGANANYRDHIFHVFRTWLIGLYVMIKHEFHVTDIDGLKENWENFGKVTTCEKISMWTIIAFCHDLGYPLEKSKDILRATQSMMQEIVTDSKITEDFSFGGTQVSINEYIVKFISTKMKFYKKGIGKVIEGRKNRKKLVKYYNGRIQPKYYLKLTKSLEEFKHGIISAIIIYKTLLYFMESDFNLNDDYVYTADDARQFYVRREILRAIAAHTCPEIYSIKVTTFSSLLYVCDEIQNWDRKDWHELYSSQRHDSHRVTINKFDETEILYNENILLSAKADIKNFVKDLFNKQYAKYKEKFRDGLYSAQRNFDIKDTVMVKKDEKDIDGSDKPRVEVSISIMGNEKSDKFEVKYNKNCKDEDRITIEDIKGSVFANEFEII